MENDERAKHSLISIIAETGSMWILAYVGYYIFLPVFVDNVGYNNTPFHITIYYLFWIFISIFAFKDKINDRKLVESRGKAISLFLAGTSVVMLYIAYIMPMFQTITWTIGAMPPSEILNATSWYFLPKSIDIFFQQILLLTLVTSFTDNGYDIRTTCYWCAGLFGGAHLLLVYGGGGFIYVSVFTIVAMVASFIFPYLLLKVKNGIIYSYFLHWSFYATVVVLTRFIFKV